MSHNRIYKPRERFYLREKSYLQRVCNTLNTILPCTGDGDTDEKYMEVTNILRRMYDHSLPPHNFGLFFNKRLYEMCGFNHNKAWDVLLFSGMVDVVVSDDMHEHPGVVVVLKAK